MSETVHGVSAALRRINALSQPLGVKVTRQLGLSTVREAKLLVHRKTGNLGRSIRVAEASPTFVRVIAGANYAAFVEFGTRAHEITPKAAQALRWAASPAGRRLSGSPRTGAAVVFAKRVHHPGTKPYPFLVPGAKRAVAKGGLKDLVIDVWNGAA